MADIITCPGSPNGHEFYKDANGLWTCSTCGCDMPDQLISAAIDLLFCANEIIASDLDSNSQLVELAAAAVEKAGHTWD